MFTISQRMCSISVNTLFRLSHVISDCRSPVEHQDTESGEPPMFSALSERRCNTTGKTTILPMYEGMWAISMCLVS